MAAPGSGEIQMGVRISGAFDEWRRGRAAIHTVASSRGTPQLVAAGIGYRYGDIVVELTAMSRHCIRLARTGHDTNDSKVDGRFKQGASHPWENVVLLLVPVASRRAS